MYVRDGYFMYEYHTQRGGGEGWRAFTCLNFLFHFFFFHQMKCVWNYLLFLPCQAFFHSLFSVVDEYPPVDVVPCCGIYLSVYVCRYPSVTIWTNKPPSPFFIRFSSLLRFRLVPGWCMVILGVLEFVLLRCWGLWGEALFGGGFLVGGMCVGVQRGGG